MGSWNKMKGEECALLKARRNNFGIDLVGIYNYSILHKLCEDWGVQFNLYGRCYMCDEKKGQLKPYTDEASTINNQKL